MNETDVQWARRRLYARIIASAALLDVPFTDAPDKSPWKLMVEDMRRLDRALAAQGRTP